MPKSNLAEEIASVGNPEAEAVVIQEALEKAKAIKPRRKRTTRKVKQVFDARMATPPAGFRWVYNRLTIPYENMFDGMVYAFDAGEYRLVLQDVAYFLWANSIISYRMIDQRGIRALALNDGPGLQEPLETEGFGEPMDPPKSPELFDRTGIGPVRVPGGLVTTPGLVSVTNPTGTVLPR